MTNRIPERKGEVQMSQYGKLRPSQGGARGVKEVRGGGRVRKREGLRKDEAEMRPKEAKREGQEGSQESRKGQAKSE